MQRRLMIIGILLFSMSASSCFFLSQQPDQTTDQAAEEVVSIYAQKENWASLPQQAERTRAVDVFYLYPTVASADDGYEVIPEEESVDSSAEEPVPDETSLDEEIPARTYGFIKDDAVLQKIDYYVHSQAGAFSGTANIFSPHYRQLGAAAVLALGTSAREEIMKKRVLPSVSEAFLYYLEELNEGRPFILAGHSQGSHALLLLMEELFSDPELQKNLVAAYLPGYSVTEQDLIDYPHLRFAAGEDDTGVIISWNTEGEYVQGNNPVVLSDALVINPLNWKTDDEFVSRIKNRGAVFFDQTGEEVIRIDRFTSAQIDPERRVVRAYEPDPRFYLIGEGLLFPRGVYHLQDYTFFYGNIAHNASVRTQAFLDQQRAEESSLR